MTAKRDYFPLFLIAPTVGCLFLVVIYPMLYSLYLSTTNFDLSSGEQLFIGVENYLEILRDIEFFESLGITLALTAVTVSGSFLIGFVLALILNRYTKGRAAILPLLLMPMMLTPVVIGLMWAMMYNADYGVFSYLLGIVGVERRSWTGDPSTALLSIIVTDIWQWTPFMMILLLSGLQSLPQEPYEASQIDGASKLQTVRFITLPMLMPTIMVAIIFRTLDAIKIFDIVYTLTAGGPGTATEVVSLFIYRTGFRFFHMGYATTLSWVLIVVTIAISQIYIKLIRKV